MTELKVVAKYQVGDIEYLIQQTKGGYSLIRRRIGKGCYIVPITSWEVEAIQAAIEHGKEIKSGEIRALRREFSV